MSGKRAGGGISEHGRRRIAVVLVILATLTGIVGLVSLWVKREVYDTDQWVEKLIARITERSPDTLFVISADHGEAFGEHGEVQHGNSLYEEEVRVPLIFYRPGRDLGATIETPVETIDVAPTLLDLLGVRVPAQMKGRDLFGADGPRPVFSGGAHGRAMLVDHAHPLAVERERLGERARQEDRRHRLREHARRVGVRIEPVGEPLVGEVEERHQAARLHHLEHLAPLRLAEIDAGGVVAARVQHDD